MNYIELKKLMIKKGFKFENYGKTIKKDDFVIINGKNKSKMETAFDALHGFFLNEYFCKISPIIINKYFEKSSYNWEKMLKELI